MSKTICTAAEFAIMEHGLASAKKRLAIARKANPESAIYQSVSSIQGQIAYLEEFLKTHKPGD